MRFGVIDGLELSWRGGQVAFSLDLYRTHRLGRLSHLEEGALFSASDLFASLVELHASLCRLALAAGSEEPRDILQAVVGLLGQGLTPREKRGRLPHRRRYGHG